MSTDFRWETDENSWPEADPTNPPPPSPPPRPIYQRPFWFSLGLILIILIATSYWWLQRRAQQQTNQIHTTIATNFTFIQQTAHNGDHDLLQAYLTPNQGWQAEHTIITNQAHDRNRHPLGLTLNTITPTINTITLNPEQTTATLTYQYQYTPLNRNTHTTTLQQTATFHYNNNRWQLAPTNTDWGPHQTRTSRYLDLNCPQKDAPICDQLINDLDNYLHAVCQQLDGYNTLCQDGSPPRVTLELSTDPLSLVDLHDPLHPYRTPNLLTLPTPTLIGLPQTEADYQTLSHGYARLLLQRFISDRLKWTCCNQLHFHHALIEQQIAQLGLPAHTLTPAQYETLYTRKTDILLTAFETWHLAPHMPPPTMGSEAVQALITYILTTTDYTTLDLQLSLPQNDTFWLWIPTLSTNSLTNQRLLTLGLRQFIFDQRPTPDSNPPISDNFPAPTQNLQLLCYTPNDQLELVNYNFQDKRWGPAYPVLNDFAFIATAAQDNGFILQERAPDWSAPTLLWLWDNDQPRLLYIETSLDGSQDIVGFRRDMSPNGRYAVMFVSEGRTSTYRFRLLDTDNCSRNGCQVHDINGQPHWSPDSQATILLDATSLNQADLYLADTAGRQPTFIGNGQAPFWLNNDTFGFVQEGTQVIIVNRDQPNQLETLFRLNNPRHRLPGPLAQPGTRIEFTVSPHPDLLLLTAVTPHDGTYLLQYHLPTNLLSLQFNAPRFLEPPRLSPQQTFLSLLAPHDEATTLFVYDTINQTNAISYTYPVDDLAYDWSQDDQWLLVHHHDTLDLFNSQASSPITLPHQYPLCRDAIWVDPLTK
ncbi:MAG TPA: hypothetical protein VLL52_03335 [Anaerolineae bacterium]|nr:hypothetical protein [Anaerolineae bacterium]